MPEGQYALTYRRTWNLGNYENETVELQRFFPDSVEPERALRILFDQVNKSRQELKPAPPTGRQP